VTAKNPSASSNVSESVTVTNSTAASKPAFGTSKGNPPNSGTTGWNLVDIGPGVRQAASIGVPRIGLAPNDKGGAHVRPWIFRAPWIRANRTVTTA